MSGSPSSWARTCSDGEPFCLLWYLILVWHKVDSYCMDWWVILAKVGNFGGRRAAASSSLEIWAPPYMGMGGGIQSPGLPSARVLKVLLALIFFLWSVLALNFLFRWFIFLSCFCLPSLYWVSIFPYIFHPWSLTSLSQAVYLCGLYLWPLDSVNCIKMTQKWSQNTTKT